MDPLCATFRELAFETWRRLGNGRRIGHQMLEETITDLNLLEIKSRHPHEVWTQQFSRPAEAVEGADWEWWFTDASRSRWFGCRVQAKIINFANDRFEHLHYRNRTTGYQADTLIDRCDRHPWRPVPLYVLYTHWSSAPQQPNAPRIWKHLPLSRESFGCSVMGARRVKSHRINNSHARDLDALFPDMYPWHYLVCRGSDQRFLPDRVRSVCEHLILRAGGDDPETPEYSEIYPVLGEPPHYVRQTLEGRRTDSDDPSLRGVVVFAGNKNGDG